MMFRETFWALVLGFGISGALQVFVSKEQMSRAFGRAGLRQIALATGLGAASSSCSYAAAAAGRSAFQKGAALVPMLAFMFASTNLVIELGALLWLLMGWHFVVAEIIGSFVLIAVMWLLIRLFFPAGLEAQARQHNQETVVEHGCCGGCDDEDQTASAGDKWTQVATAFVTDWKMLAKEIAIGFLLAGFIAALVPANWWRALFLQSGPPAVQLIENALVGPLIAVASFVCSCGNIPLASVLWTNGISFGGVISFIYGDLIVIPLIMIYAKYYGVRAAAYITAILYASMVVAGIVVDLLFSAFRLIPTDRQLPVDFAHSAVTCNYTMWLNLAALLAAASMFVLHRRGTTAATRQ
jgi:hypothetical protein